MSTLTASKARTKLYRHYRQEGECRPHRRGRLESDSGNHVSPVNPRNEAVDQARHQDTHQGVFKGARLVKWQVVFTKQAQKDAKNLASAGLREKADKLLGIIEEDPYCSNPPFENLVGDLQGAYSRRINIHNRLVYQVLERQNIIKVIRMFTHYE
jgi:toxin YoeB